MKTKLFTKLISAMLIIVFVFSQTAFAFEFIKKPTTSDNFEYAKKSAEIVYLYNENSGKNQTNSLSAPLRIIGKTKDKNYDFKSIGAADYAVCDDGRFLLQFKKNSDFYNALDILKNDPKIIYAERDAMLYVQTTDTEDDNDISWGANVLKKNEYTEYIHSQNPQSKVTVAVIDSGVAELDFFENRVVKGYDFVQNDSDPSNDTSSNSHGTFLASIIADTTRNLNVDILSVRIVEDTAAYISNAVNGIYYAVDNGADIINFSLCGKLPSRDCKSLEEAVNYAISNDVTFVTCAGNQSSDTVDYCPAHIANIITTSAIKENLGFLNGTSNYGDEVDVCAPGESVTGYKADGTLQMLSGTSISAAYISACAAMIKLVNPDYNPYQIQDALKRNCLDLGDEGFDVYYGYGLPQLDRFITDSVVYANKINLDKNSVILDINEKVKLNAEVLPANATNKEVTWISDNSEIAQVDGQGNVITVDYGITQIRAVTSDGRLEAIAQIIVKEPEYIIGININKIPNKTVYRYKVDDSLDLTGIEIDVIYSDGETKPLTDTDNVTVGAFDCKSIGEQNIKISYGGYTAEFKVTVEYAWWQWIIRILLLGFLWY